MFLPANLKGIRINWIGAKDVDLVITLEKVPISALGLLWDIPAGPIKLQIEGVQGRLLEPPQREEVRVSEAFR